MAVAETHKDKLLRILDLVSDWRSFLVELLVSAFSVCPVHARAIAERTQCELIVIGYLLSGRSLALAVGG